jgi:hypothetical protein
MNILITHFRNISNKKIIPYIFKKNNSYYSIVNYEILHKKFKDLMYQQNLTNQIINDLIKKLELIENKIIKLEKK